MLWIIFTVWVIFAITCAVLVDVYEHEFFGFLFLKTLFIVLLDGLVFKN